MAQLNFDDFTAKIFPIKYISIHDSWPVWEETSIDEHWLAKKWLINLRYIRFQKEMDVEISTLGLLRE